MKVLTTALGAASFLLATSAMTAPASAFGVNWNDEGCVQIGWVAWICPPEPEVPVDCELCDDTSLSIRQFAAGWQEAYNNMYDIGSADDVTQTALNALNLISLDGLTDLDDAAISIGAVEQIAYAGQVADNDLMGDNSSDVYGVVQAATNLINSIGGTTLTWAEQDAWGHQDAQNYLVFGSGGYDADDDFEDPTQSAANLANLISVDELTGGIDQHANVSQSAINTAEYSTDYEYHWFFKHPVDATVYDFDQSATNVANSISIPAIDPLECECLEILDLDAQIMQSAKVDQLAVNDLYATGYWGTGLIDVTNITQTATNIANSIGMPSVDEE